MKSPTLRQSAAPAWLLIALVAACAEIPTDLEGLNEVPPVLAPPTGAAFTGELRLGVVPSAVAIDVGSAEAFEVRDGVTGATVMTGTNETVTVTYVDQSFPGKTSFRLLTKQCVSVEDRDAYVALAALKHEQDPTRGFVTYAEDKVECWNVYLGDKGLSTSSSTRNQFRTMATQQGLAKLSDQWFRVTTITITKGFKIVKGSSSVTTPNFVKVHPVGGRTKVADQEVDGQVEVFRNTTGTLTAVNAVPLEQYLRRVLPLTLPPDLYGSVEAQKAQAVAERTRALYNVGRHAAEGFDFYPNEYQPYGGAEVENEISTAAIDATAGLVAKYEGQLIDTPYHPSSGGWTANSEDVFAPVVPYLRGISESNLPWGIEKKLTLEVFARSGATDLRAVDQKARGAWSKFNLWQVDWTNQEMAAALTSSFGVTVTSVTDIRVVERGAYGRVRRVEFDTDAGTLVAEKNDIRAKLPWLTLEGAWEPLSSTLIFVVPVVDDSEQISGWRVYGAGLGHGVGMSQIGAVMRSDQGTDFATILSTYYTGIVVEPWN